MKLKKLSRSRLLPILLLLLLTRDSYAQALPESPEKRSSDYGIEPGKSYPGTAVLELIAVAEEEIDAAVSEAYAEGYKASMLRYAPDATAYKTTSEILQRELDAERKRSRYFWPAIGVSVGLSFAAGFLLHFLAVR